MGHGAEGGWVDGVVWVGVGGGGGGGAMKFKKKGGDK